MKNFELTDDDVERIFAHTQAINRVDALRRVKYLLEHSKPGNWAYRELEDRWGFVGDYTEADHGEPPKGANW